MVADYDALLEWFRDRGSALVAFSGGVDSTLLAQAAGYKLVLLAVHIELQWHR